MFAKWERRKEEKKKKSEFRDVKIIKITKTLVHREDKIVWGPG